MNNDNDSNAQFIKALACAQNYSYIRWLNSAIVVNLVNIILGILLWIVNWRFLWAQLKESCLELSTTHPYIFWTWIVSFIGMVIIKIVVAKKYKSL